MIVDEWTNGQVTEAKNKGFICVFKERTTENHLKIIRNLKNGSSGIWSNKVSFLRNME